MILEKKIELQKSTPEKKVGCLFADVHNKLDEI